MKITLKTSYIILLISSILLYAIPFEYGGNIMRGIIALITIGFLIYTIRKIWQDFKSSERFNVSILLINSLAILHFSLIFLTLVIEASYLFLFIIGILIGGIIFNIVSKRMENY